MKVPMLDLAAEYKKQAAQIDRGIKRVLGSGWYLLGRELEEFERRFGKYIGVKHTIGVANGTEALTIALKALNLKPSDEVILPANSYPSFFGVAWGQANVRLADVEAADGLVNLHHIKKVATKLTRVVIVVHMYGKPVDMEPIITWARKNKVWIVEDCAQAHGAKYKNKKVGTWGDVACYSFYPSKNLGAIGDGGAVVTNNPELAARLRAWRMYGETRRYLSEMVGMNSRLSELQAAILTIKLNKLDNNNARRAMAVAYYRRKLRDLPVQLLGEDKGQKSSNHLFVIRTAKRDDLQNYLKQKQIISLVHYPKPIHLQQSAKYLGYKLGDFPQSEVLSQEVLSLPLFPSITRRQQDYVIKTIATFFAAVPTAEHK